MTNIYIKTWACSCGYKQDFDPNDINMMAKVFPGVSPGSCPACYMGHNLTKIRAVLAMERVTDPEKASRVTIADDAPKRVVDAAMTLQDSNLR